jgi:hypothetical protein
LLIPAYVLATCGVVIGVYFERKKFSASTNDRGEKILLVSLATELLFGVLIFVVDARISTIQDNEIIALEERMAPRVVTDADRAAIGSLRGKVRAVSVISSPDVEPAMFSAQLQEAFFEAGIAVNPVPNSAEQRFVGTQLCLRANESMRANSLWKVLAAIGLNPGHCSLDSIAERVPKDVPLIIIGERPPFSPNGSPSSFRFRAYPGLAPKPQSE